MRQLQLGHALRGCVLGGIGSLGLLTGIVSFDATFAHSPSSAAKQIYGPYGPESPRMREQLWLVPSGIPGTPLRATVFRPKDDPPGIGTSAVVEKRRHLVVINHGSSDLTRAAVSMPVYYWLSRWFVERGYVVVLPERLGHGATGGPFLEGQDDCLQPDHVASGLAGALQIQAVADYMSQQPFIEPVGSIVVGISTGGWAALALASLNPPTVSAIVNFSGGRGAYAWGRAGQICGEASLIEAARKFGANAKIRSLWLYAENDSYFKPSLARAMSAAWNEASGRADFHVLPAYGQEGHDIADERAGSELWGPYLDAFLSQMPGALLSMAQH